MLSENVGFMLLLILVVGATSCERQSRMEDVQKDIKSSAERMEKDLTRIVILAEAMAEKARRERLGLQ
jgi:hypothetical protein